MLFAIMKGSGSYIIREQFVGCHWKSQPEEEKMDAYSRQLFEKHEVASLVNYVDDLDPEHFSLITFIDSLVPELVMESNLRFGSFHLVKMSLFIRNLSKRGVFSSETEIELAKLVIQHLYHLEWISVSADSLSHAADPVTDPLGEMLSEIADNNAHNAYFYASQAFFEDKQALFNLLLLNGAISIPHSLGHSISCFYPVLEDVIAVDHPAAGTSLLSLIMYLCRFGKETSAEADEKPLRDSDKGQLLRRAASGNDIVSIHHMITFYILQTWENASWNQDTIPPWSLLTDWIGEKRVDEKRVALAAKPEAASRS